MEQPLDINLELTIDEWVGTNMRAYPILYQNRMDVIKSIFTTFGAGYYWKNGRIGNYLITQRSVDALEEFKKRGHIPDMPSDITCPPYISEEYSMICKIPDDIEPDALAAVWEVLDYLDCDPSDEPISQTTKEKSEHEKNCDQIAHDILIEIYAEEKGLSFEKAKSELKAKVKKWKNENRPSPQMRNWKTRKQNQEIAQRIKKDLIKRGLVI